MTDRVKGFTVTLDQDYRDDCLDELITAIKMLKGVVDVEPTITDPSDHINRALIKHEFKQKLANNIHAFLSEI